MRNRKQTSSNDKELENIVNESKMGQTTVIISMRKWIHNREEYCNSKYLVGKKKGITTDVKATERGAGSVARRISEVELPLLLEMKSR